MAHSAAVGDYLKAIYKLQQGDEPVTTMALAAHLKIKAASATGMVKKLATLALAEHTPYHGVRLTTQGEIDALELIRHHRLLELYLAQQVGLPWEKVDAEAERLEHVLSEDLEDRLDEILGHPTCDPHGDPIPSRNGTLPQVTLHRLHELACGDRAIVRRVSDRDPEALRRIGQAGLFPGTAVQIVEQSSDDALLLWVEEREHRLAVLDAGRVLVERTSS